MSATDYFIGELYRTKALRWISVGNKKLTSRIRRAKPVLRHSGPVLARPQYLVYAGKKCVDRPLRQRRETGYCSTFHVRVASSVGALPSRAVPALFGCMQPHLRLCFAPLLLASPTHVALPISRPIAEFEHVFSFVSGFIRADLHKHDTVQSSNNNHKILWSV